MARIFISYSRVDKSFVEELAAKLRRIYGYDNVWFDEGLHGGDIWWEEILDQIEARDIFLYVLSNESVQSKYCKAEFEEARRLQKQIITVQARDRTKLTDKLGDIHYIDMAHDPNDANAFANLVASINKRERIAEKRKLKPLWQPRTPKPAKEDEKPRPDNAPDVETPTLQVPRAEIERPTQQTPWWKKPEFLIGAILIPVVAVIIGGLIQNPDFFGSGGDDATEIVQAPTDVDESDTATDTLQPGTTETPTLISEEEMGATAAAGAFATLTANAPTDTSTTTLTPSNTPISQTDFELTVQAEIFATATSTQLTAEAVARQTRRAEETQVYIAGLTATHSFNLSQTPPATNTPVPTSTPTATRTPSSTPTPNMPEPERVALEGVDTNDEWENLVGDEGYVREFTGVEMVLVPSGCFVMGNDSEAYFWNGSSYVQDVPNGEEQCFDEPFWVDKTEVTQADFERLDGVNDNGTCFDGANRPVECITWFEARDFCALRGGRLPTEAEWEYVARGPDELYFPWGNDWNTNNAVWSRSSSQGTATVGSILTGASWVGALDMSGNVWEWTRSVYEDYPYVASDGREADLGEETDVRYALRGGSWYYTNFDSWRSAARYGSSPSFRLSFNGFRCVLSYE